MKKKEKIRCDPDIEVLRERKKETMKLSELSSYYYFAYGRNVNPQVMKRRCPTAMIVGKGEKKNYKLAFKLYSTIEKYRGKSVTGILYKLFPTDIKNLNIYESYPKNYHICVGTANKGKEVVNIFWYDKNKETLTSPPTSEYLTDIMTGYKAFGLKTDWLYDAIRRCENAVRARHRSVAKMAIAIEQDGSLEGQITMEEYLREKGEKE